MFLSKVLGLLVLLVASGLLYDLAASPEFHALRVSVSGNSLLTAQEVEAASSVTGANLFRSEERRVGKECRL